MSINPPETPVDLEREFAPIPQDDRLESRWHRALARLSGSARKWEQLNSRAVVVLGEAGSGKTAELAMRAMAMRTRGEYAFAIHLADVDAQPERVIGREWREFEAWLDGTREATLFLDGLDEAKAAGIPLDTILDGIASWMGTACSRARLVLSARPSEWEPVVDAAHLRRALAAWAPGRTDDSDAVVVSLVPLDLERVRRYATSLGVPDVDAFVEAIRGSGLDDFMERPRDVEWLASRWQVARRLGELRTLIDANITQKLSDRRALGRTVNLPIDRARSGVQRLAAVATFSATRSFPIRDSASLAELHQRPVEILSEWRRDEVEDLLLLPIFDESTLTTLRIHSKAVQEYLSAEWCLEQLRSGLLTQDRLRTLLFRQAGPSTVVPEHLTSTAAWLAIDDPLVCDMLIKHAPQHLIDQGDPAALPSPTRERVLREYAARFSDRDHTDIRFDHQGLRRFASTELAPAILELLDAVESEHVRATLLDLIGAGRLRECADAATTLAIQTSTPPRVLYAAVGAAARAGTAEHRSGLLALVPRASTLDLDVVGALVEHLFPDPLTPAMLRDVLCTVAPRGAWNRVTVLDSALLEQVIECPEPHRLDVIDALQEAVGASRDSWLVRPLVDILAKHLQHSPVDIHRPAIQRALIRLDTEDQRWDSDTPSLRGLADVARESEDVRRALLRSFVERRRAQGDEITGEMLEHVLFVEPSLTLADLAWLEAAIPEVAAAAAAARLWIDRPRVVVAAPPSPTRGFDPEDVQYILDHEVEFRGGHPNLLQHVTGPYMSGRDWGTVDVARMRDDLGPAAVDAVRAGLTHVWRNLDVPVPRDQTENSTPGAVVLALIGLHLDFADGLAANSLSDQAARRAARIALWELGHFPPWLPALLAAHRETVVREVVDEALAELNDSRVRDRILHKAFAGPRDLGRAVATAIVRSLLDGSLSLSARLEPAIELALQSDQLDRSSWAAIAQRGLASATSDLDLWTLLLALQSQVEPSAATAEIMRLAEAGTPDAQSRVVALANVLWRWEDRTGIDLHFDVHAAEALYVALVLVQDPNTSDFSSTRRLRPEMVRRLEAEGQLGRDVFARLATRTDGAFQDLRDFHLAAAMHAEVADSSATPMPRSVAIQWVRDCEADPSTEDGVFDLTLARLDDITTFLRDHRFSYRRAFLVDKKAVPERLFQLWLAAELQARSARRYNVVREEEERDQKRPDLRIHVTGLRPTSIELKVAERWSLADLRAALSTQLVGQYMGEVNSRHGILGLCVTRRGATWREPDGRRLTLDDVVVLLRNDAKAIADSRARGVERIGIVVLDFRDPTTTLTKTKQNAPRRSANSRRKAARHKAAKNSPRKRTVRRAKRSPPKR